MPPVPAASPAASTRTRVPLLLLLLLTFGGLQACDRGPVSPGAGVAVSEGGNAGAAQSRPAVVISQVYGGGGNSGAPLTHDFVELFNPGEAPVDIGGWRIHYASATGTTWSNVTTLPPGSSIAAGGYFLVQMGGGSTGAALPAPDFTGSTNMAAGSAKVVLTGAGTTLASVACPEDAGIVDRVNYGAANCAAWASAPTLSNTTAALRNDNGCAWNGDQSNDFTAGAPAPRNSASPTHSCTVTDPVPAAVIVQPAVATLSIGGTQPFVATAQNAAGQPVSTTFTWSSGDTDIATIDAAMGVATAVADGIVTITATAANGVSGAASLVVSAEPAAVVDIVISQVYGGGGNSGATYTHDFVELFNRGEEPVNVSGWTVQYASSAGTSWNAVVLPAGTGSLIPVGGYYLVQLATNNEAVGAAMPAPDATGGLNLAAASGKVVLARPGATLSGACPAGDGIADRVNFGAANCSVDWGTTPTLSASLAAHRNENGCAHTGNVSADFARAPPMPRNSGSLRNDCQGPVSVSVEPASITIQTGATFTFTASGVASDGMPTAASFSWTSSDAAIAVIDAATGVATALAEGSTTITAAAQNGVAGTALLTVTSPPPATGLIITEFMSDPDGADAIGEWFEIFNAGPADVDLAGWHLRSNSSTGVEAHTIAHSVVVPAGGFAVLGNNGDTNTNGGVAIAYSYGGDIILNNSNTDWLTLKRPDGTLEDSVAYSARSAEGVIISPQYTPTPATSRVLVNIDLDNSVAATSNWQNATVMYGDGRNRGSPGWGAYGVAGPVASVVVSPATGAVLVGGSTTFSSLALDALGKVSSEALSWSSSDAAIASVHPTTGLVTGLAEGVVVITATSSSGVSGTASLAVVHPDSPASVTVGLAEPLWLPVGYEKRAFATVRDWENNILPPEVVWTVSHPERAEMVEYDGRMYVRTLAAGSVEVRATAGNGVWGARTFTILPADAPTPAVYRNHVEFGLPTDSDASDDVIIEKRGFVASYNPALGGPNWVSWNLNATQFGSVPRCDCFSPDLQLPAGVPRIVDSDYINGGYDRGHMVQSESRTSTEQENAATFLFTNILPQAADNNQGSWLNFENHLNNLARQQGREIYVIAGGEYAAAPPTIKDEGRISIPDFTWKIAVIMESGHGLADVAAPSDLQVLAVRMPNLVSTAQRNAPWQQFATTVDAIEQATGYDFLSALPDWIESIVESGTRPPVASSGGPYTGIEGAAVAFDGSGSSDPDEGDVLSFAWSFGDGSSGSGVAPTHTYADNGVFDVRLIVSDQFGAADTTWTTATIANAPPVVTELVVPVAAALGTAATAQVTYADAGVADSHMAIFEWGDGTSTTVAGAAGSATATHAYAATGFYTVRVTVRDNDGGEAVATAALAVAVFDPNGAVAGGGTLDAPAGALPQQPSASGRANLAFTARSTTGGAAGQLEFHVNAASFRFTADALQWLVIDGTRATLQGTGRVRNDDAAYSFTLVVQAGQGGGAAARMVIRDAGGAIVFDNVPGAAADSLGVVNGQINIRQ